MTIHCYGSINIDHVYRVPRMPAPGETLAASAYAAGLGGKGANQSVAAARAGARVVHLGAVGRDGLWARDALAAHGVDCARVRVLDGVATGHAVIMVDPEGENSIVLHDGANHALDPGAIDGLLAGAELGDIVLLQNETAHVPAVAEAAMGRGLEVIYSAAPFDVAAARAVLPFVNMLVLNALEAGQLRAALGVTFEDLPVESVVVTRGAEGAEWHARGMDRLHMPAFAVRAVDTTGAGDCFAGSLAAMLDAGRNPAEAMRYATAAAALQVTRPGAAAAMPARAEVGALLAEGWRASPGSTMWPMSGV